MAGTDHHIVGGQSAADLYLARKPLTENDLGLNRAAIHDAVDQNLLVRRNDGGLGHQHRVWSLFEDDADAGEEAWRQPAVAIGNPGAQADGPAVDVDDRIDRVDTTLEACPRHGIGRDQDLLPDSDLCGVEFRHAEVDLESID